MRGRISLILAAFALLSCSKYGADLENEVRGNRLQNLSHEMIVLGQRLENPYKTENMSKALASLYPAKAGLVAVDPTDLYVRFLPENQEELEQLKEADIHLLDHPLDYDILVEGDWYHDPEVPDGEVTWQ